MGALIRQPLLHFLALGALLLAAERLLLPQAADAALPTIVVTADDVARLHAEWIRDGGHAPSGAQLRASIARHVDDELLLAEALRLSLDAHDPVARERLLRNMRFAFPQRRASEAALLHEARAMEMARRDPIVRRRLIQAMERRLGASLPYDERALRDYVERNAARYATPARYGFRHVYFSADAARADLQGAIEHARAQLEPAPAPAAELGDAFLLGTHFRAMTADVIAQRFGAGFARAVADAPIGAWIGPLQSPYGWHLVQLVERTPPQRPDFVRVAPQAAQAWLAERRVEALQDALERLRQRYRVEVAVTELQEDAG
ncbi:MAG: peptidyl-prolyl cis-trans isomerase [Gammaproteobacteria bacterium]